MFDVGACPGHASASNDVFLSHLHIDHAQALPYYACHRNMLQLPPGRVHVPAGTGPGVRAWVDAMARLQGPAGLAEFHYELCEMAPGDSATLRGRATVVAFATDHRVPSLGFTALESKEKLLGEFAHLSGGEIAARKRAGELLTRRVETPVFTYLGDTGPRVFDQHPEVGESEVLVAECTFLAPEHRANALETKHLHLDDFVARAELFRNRALVLTHFSMRYSRAEIAARVQRALPEELFSRVHLMV